ncbi:MAG: NUDIX domain-containing protein [Spirochaetales bacterium]|nr:NUDIX domain-containing protein [Spirochaetales bacterium]
MENNEFTFCPDCGSKTISTDSIRRKWDCPECGFTLYNNIASAVGLVIVNSKGEVLLEKRAKDPRKGYLALPGGFVDAEESLEEAAHRECREEIGTDVSSLKYIASFPNTYDYRNFQYKTCDVFFEAQIPSDAEFKFQESEVTGVVWMPCTTKEEVEKIPFAFESARKTLLTRIQ